MAKIRINFGISDHLREWIKTQPNVIMIAEESVNHVTFEHNMSAGELNAFKSAVIQRLAEDVT